MLYNGINKKIDDLKTEKKVTKSSKMTTNVKKPRIRPSKAKNPINKKTGLTLKQQKFIDNYIISGNATESAIKAGYSKKTAKAIGQENLTKPTIKEAIAKRLEKIESKKIATMEEVLQFATSVMRGEIDEEVIVTEGMGDGWSKAIIKKKQVSPKDRLTAMDRLMKRYGLLTEKVEIKHEKENENTIHEEMLNALKTRKIVGLDEDDD